MPANVDRGARERFVSAYDSNISAYDSNIGAIGQMFPRDRAQQDRNKGEIATSHAPADASGGDTPHSSDEPADPYIEGRDDGASDGFQRAPQPIVGRGFSGGVS